VSAIIKLSFPATRQFWEIPVLYEDAHLLALDKPSELAMATATDSEELPALMPLLHAAIAEQKPWAKERDLNYLRASHRLDAEASGVVLLAKSKPALQKLLDLFGSEKPHKLFLALSRGTARDSSFAVEAALAPYPGRPGLMRVDSRSGKRSRTLFEAAERFSGYELLRCEPLTDRPHQIRAHLRHLGLTVVGDRAYGGKPLFLSRLKPDYRLRSDQLERPLIGRPALHCERLTLPHPASGEPLSVVSPLPKDFRVALKYLRQFGGNPQKGTDRTGGN
jgi:23S rRNA pseudouridine955/2504/2580 synthase/23S rRNA pseudouridine1911/1915/1917 synthase